MGHVANREQPLRRHPSSTGLSSARNPQTHAASEWTTADPLRTRCPQDSSRLLLASVPEGTHNAPQPLAHVSRSDHSKPVPDHHS
jgi:hypothetical protein